MLITSSALRNSSQAAIGGVGFLLNKKAEAALCEINGISHRIIKATFAGNPECTIVPVYAPTNCREHNDDSDRFYTWTLTVAEEKSLDGTYTRMLTKVKNVLWQDKIANKTLWQAETGNTNNP